MYTSVITKIKKFWGSSKGMENTTINVLGTNYNIIFTSEVEDYPCWEECNGFIDFTVKKIYIRNQWQDPDTMKDMYVFIKKTTRHEIIHAFLYESGLNNDSKRSNSWAINEEMVDWIAIQFPKIKKVFEEVGVIE